MLSVPLKLILGSCVYPDFYKNKDELSINDDEKKLSKSIRDRIFISELEVKELTDYFKSLWVFIQYYFCPKNTAEKFC